MSYERNALAALTAVSLVAMPAAAYAATADELAGSSNQGAAEQAAVSEVSLGGRVEVAEVQGSFGFSQVALTPCEIIKAVFQKATAALCNATQELTVADAEDWVIKVTGDVQQAYTATLGELASEDENTTVMGCTCISNGAGGPAAINAEVTGVPLATIIARALPEAGANTVTLVSEDGYEIALPLSYVMARNSILTYDINGADLSESVGGTNQLWIDSTAAKYFTRNVVEIRITNEDVVPAAPGSEDAVDGEYVNRPNVGVTAVN